LTGKEWQYWSKSVVNKPYPIDTQHHLRSKHGGQKPPMLCADLIKVFTKKGMRVLDPFAGVGGTLLGASLSGRRAVGVELNPKWTDIYDEVCRLEGLQRQELLVGDSKIVLRDFDDGEFDFVLTDVPFWNMDSVQRSKGKYKAYGKDKMKKIDTKLQKFNESSNAQSKQDWLAEMREIFSHAFRLLRQDAYLAVFIGDMYKDGRYHYLSADLAGELERVGFTQKACLVWYDVSKKLRIYGYLYDYIPSMIHQNILIFKKH
jgi:DNA modification methylase